MLAYVAENDGIEGVRDKAKDALDADVKRRSPSLPPRSEEAVHIFGVRCKNGHVTYFNKQKVCSDYRVIERGLREGVEKELDELHLECGTCGELLVTHVDCEGYR